MPGKKRLYVTATGEYKACERIGSSPSIGNVDEGVDRELIVKKYVEEFAAQSKDICDKCSGACIIVVVVSLGGKQYSFTQSRLRSFHIIKSLQYRSKRKRNHF